MGDMSSEPSMEEILSSIKKIIAEDGDKGSSLSRRAQSRLTPVPSSDIEGADRLVAPEPEFNDEDVVLELTESDEVQTESSAELDGTSSKNGVGHIIDAGEDELKEPVMAAKPKLVAESDIAEKAPAPVAEIVSGDTEAKSRVALAALSALIVKPEVHGSDTLEGLVREMLKPMLKEWLDANLPALVETVVEKEVARISGRGF